MGTKASLSSSSALVFFITYVSKAITLCDILDTFNDISLHRGFDLRNDLSLLQDNNLAQCGAHILSSFTQADLWYIIL